MTTAPSPLPGVLLDSNAYLALSDARFDALLEAERRRGVARYCEPFVVSEFLAHLADPADPAFGRSRRAVVRVYRRCNVAAGGECGILRDSEARLCEFITGKVLEKHDAYTEQVVAPLVGDIGLTPHDRPLPPGMYEHLRAIAAHLAGVEAQFADVGRGLKAVIATAVAGEDREGRKATMKGARRTHESSATRRNFADTIIRQAYENAELAPPDPLPDALVARVLKGAAAAIEFEALIWDKLAFDGANPDKTRIRNLRWDQRIAFNIGQTMRGRPLWLVTDDGDFARAAKAAGHEDRVYTLAAYERWLGIRDGGSLNISPAEHNLQ